MKKASIHSIFFPVPALIVASLIIANQSFVNKDKPLEKLESSDVLIIYSHGLPSKTISEIKPDEVDALTTATPADINTKTIAEQIEVEFRFRGYKTKLAVPAEINDAKDILQYKMLIMGTGVRFWNMTWEMKRMIDIVLGKIYIASKNDFRKIAVGAFAQAEFYGSGTAAINAIAAAASDCGSKLVATSVFLTSNNMPKDTMMVKIKKFVDEMESGLRKK